jgi:hypothetical protein
MAPPKTCSLHWHNKPVILEHVPHSVENPENPYERYICPGPYGAEKVIEYRGYQIYGEFQCVGCKFLGDLAWFDFTDNGHVFHCNAGIIENKGTKDEYVVRHTSEFSSGRFDSECKYYQKGPSIPADNSDCSCISKGIKHFHEHRPWVEATPEKSIIFDGETTKVIYNKKEEK